MTKLSEFQKANLIDMRDSMPAWATVTCFPEQKFTIATSREFADSKMLRVSVSFCSDIEPKFKKKVGKFHALTKMENGEFNQFCVPKAYQEQFLENFVEFLESWSHY